MTWRAISARPCNLVLIYNLPETVKEGDIEKLSFAVELAQAGPGRYYPRCQRTPFNSRNEGSKRGLGEQYLPGLRRRSFIAGRSGIAG
jgi:hypothetical protein